MNNHAAAAGTYLLLLECNNKAELSIGRLGNMLVEPGYYLYVGSAFSPGGIPARLRHHRKRAASPHWHIDYLRAVTELVDAWCVRGSRCEHAWANSLVQSEAVTIPLTGFGSSDCDCATHLFYSSRRPLKTTLEKLLKNKLDKFDDLDR